MLGLQPWHLIIIVIVALIIFGPRRLPDIGRGMGKAIQEFRKGSKEMAEGFRDEVTPERPAETRALQAQQAAVPLAPPVVTAPVASAPQAGAAPSAPGEKMFCHQCGSPNPPDSRFCSRCGNQFPAG